MRRVHWAVERRLGRMITRRWLNTRVSSGRWNPVPMPPAEAAARIAPIPFLVVHGDRDPYFPVEHAHQLYTAAREPKELWVVPGFGHAESGSSDALVDRIAAWVDAATATRAGTGPGDAQAERAGAA
jgi:pimeloyl-ACP methyl ester carboxylesterase